MDKQELKELAEWAGLEWKWNHNPNCPCGAVDDDDSRRSWYSKDGALATRFYYEQLDFTHSLDACFTHLVPKLKRLLGWKEYYKFLLQWVSDFTHDDIEPALAFCLATKKIIKGGRK